MDKSFKFWVGTVVAYILVIIYAGSVYIMVFDHKIVSENIVSGESASGIETITTLVGGLISALIISVLAVSQTDPVEKLTGLKSKTEIKAMVIYGYIIVWLVTGVTALIMGTILSQVKGPFIITVSDIGTAWLATAVASGYAYFGITPSSSAQS